MIVFLFKGGHVKINLTNEVPVQIDGEPWVQGPGELVILKSALKVISNHSQQMSI